MTVQLTSTHLVVTAGALVATLLLGRWSVRPARRAATTAKAAVPTVALLWRAVVTAALLLAVQWVVITNPTGNPTLLLVLLAGPDLLAARVITRALTVTSIEEGRRGGGRR